MISFDSPFAIVPAPYHFEANELNIIGGKMVYTYNLDWTDKAQWKEKAQVPTRCSMGYMLPSDDPLEEKAWRYQDFYLMNPGDDGFEYSNNHTHLHKYEGQWYLFYHTLALKKANGIKGGYRSIGVDKIEVDEERLLIHLTHSTNEGVDQIRTVDPCRLQQMETTFATHNIRFEADSTQAGNMLAMTDATGLIMVKGVNFDKPMKSIEFNTIGRGQIDVRLDSIDGELIASTAIDNKDLQPTTTRLASVSGIHDLVFLLNGETLKVDSWIMK